VNEARNLVVCKAFLYAVLELAYEQHRPERFQALLGCIKRFYHERLYQKVAVAR
jgi:hypothetical protein